jgi:hypothetical protein
MYWQTTLQMSLSRIIPRCQEKKNGKSYKSSKLLASWQPQSRNSVTEDRSAIKQLSSRKASGYGLITGRILNELPDVGMRAITLIFNSIVRTGYFLGQWKVSQIIRILKPGKPADEVMSYRPINLLPIFSKLYEKLFLTRIQPTVHDKRIIPDHQFGFRQKHATIEQVHRIINIINRAMGRNKYCTAAFIDISQAFEKVWYKGLLYKLNTLFPDNVHKILKSYLENRYFLIK